MKKAAARGTLPLSTSWTPSTIHEHGRPCFQVLATLLASVELTHRSIDGDLFAGARQRFDRDQGRDIRPCRPDNRDRIAPGGATSAKATSCRTRHERDLGRGVRCDP